MLILARRVGETLVIGEGIKVTVMGYKGSQVRLGIEAPPNVTVHREEIFQKIQSDEATDDSAQIPNVKFENSENNK
jgi:carbon storage regulator